MGCKTDDAGHAIVLIVSRNANELINPRPRVNSGQNDVRTFVLKMIQLLRVQAYFALLYYLNNDILVLLTYENYRLCV